MRSNVPAVLLVLALAAVPAVPAWAGAAEEIEEVVVKGTPLWELRAAILDAEDQFVARYNTLNAQDDFDIECLQYTPTGTRLSRRYCLTQLQIRAQAEDSFQLMVDLRSFDIQDSASSAAPMAAFLPQTQVRLLERSAEYRRNLATLLAAHPELRQLAARHGEARRKYQAELLKRARKHS